MKKILLIAPPLNPHSGWGRYSLAVIKELRSRPDFEVTVLAEGKELGSLSSINALVKNCLYVRKAARSADIVHALEAWPHGIYGYAGVLGTHKKLFINTVGTYSIVPLKSLIKGMMLRAAYHRARAVMAISDYTSRRLKQFIKLTSVKTVHLGMNTLPPATADELEATRKKFLLETAHPLVLTVGEIKHRKGQLDTLKAVLQLKGDFPHIRYLCVGRMNDADYIGRMRAYATEHHSEEVLDMQSGIGDADLACLYVLSDVVALNSNNDQDHFEGFGMVLIEANSFGTSVVGSRETGIEDAIEEGYSGFLAAQGDSADIAKAIRLILTGDKERLQQQALEFASRFSWRKTVDQYIEEYNRSAP